jgi:hypothetical protein
MIKAEVDMAKLQRSLRSAAKGFGESSKQAVIRWGVQTAREMAVETQVWGKSKTKGKQEGAMLADAYKCILVVDNILKASERNGWFSLNQGKFQYWEDDRVLKTAEQINDWIEINRMRKKGRTSKLAWINRKVAHRDAFKKAMRMRFKLSGMAKGGWLGAGQEIARAQTGQGRINIGRNFLGYAQKHSKFGSAKKPINPFKPITELRNTVRHSSASDVLGSGASQKAIIFGLRKTTQWYRKAAKASLDNAK